MKPDFEEKQYETAANGELQVQSPQVYAPGQVAERILGFDAATLQPLSSPLWSYLQVGAPPGLQLVPNLWPAGSQPGPDVKLPSYVVSLMLQYKRSEELTRPNATQYPFWGGNYYRFEIVDHQQVQLASLEQATSGHAIVRYAAPTFIEYDILESHQLNRRILANSNFVSPAMLGTTHSVWTFTQPGIAGYANPEGEKIPAEGWSQIVKLLTEQGPVTTVLKHLRTLASAIGGLEVGQLPELPKRREILDAVPEDGELAQGVLDMLTVGRGLGRCGTSWWLHVTPAPAQASAEKVDWEGEGF